MHRKLTSFLKETWRECSYLVHDIEVHSSLSMLLESLITSIQACSILGLPAKPGI